MPSSFQPHSDDLAMRTRVRQAVARAGENGLADELTLAQAQLTLDHLNTLAAETLSAWQKTADSTPTPASIALLRESRTAAVEAFRLALTLSRGQKYGPVPTRGPVAPPTGHLQPAPPRHTRTPHSQDHIPEIHPTTPLSPLSPLTPFTPLDTDFLTDAPAPPSQPDALARAEVHTNSANNLAPSPPAPIFLPYIPPHLNLILAFGVSPELQNHFLDLCRKWQLERETDALPIWSRPPGENERVHEYPPHGPAGESDAREIDAYLNSLPPELRENDPNLPRNPYVDYLIPPVLQEDESETTHYIKQTRLRHQKLFDKLLTHHSPPPTIPPADASASPSQPAAPASPSQPDALAREEVRDDTANKLAFPSPSPSQPAAPASSSQPETPASPSQPEASARDEVREDTANNLTPPSPSQPEASARDEVREDPTNNLTPTSPSQPDAPASLSQPDALARDEVRDDSANTLPPSSSPAPDPQPPAPLSKSELEIAFLTKFHSTPPHIKYNLPKPAYHQRE